MELPTRRSVLPGPSLTVTLGVAPERAKVPWPVMVAGPVASEIAVVLPARLSLLPAPDRVKVERVMLRLPPPLMALVAPAAVMLAGCVLSAMVALPVMLRLL